MFQSRWQVSNPPNHHYALVFAPIKLLAYRTMRSVAIRQRGHVVLSVDNYPDDSTRKIEDSAFRLAQLRYSVLCVGVLRKGVLMSEKFSADWWEKFRASPLYQDANNLRASSETELVAHITAADSNNGRTDRTQIDNRSASQGSTARLF